MIKKETKTIVRSVVVDTLCDVCGSSVLGRESWDASFVNIEMASGEVYPECDTRDFVRYDLCCDCFKKNLEPFLQSIGAKRYEKRGDDEYAD